MANANYVRMEGLDTLSAELDRMGKNSDKFISKALVEGGKIFAQDARGRVSYSKLHHQSHLKNAIDVGKVKKDSAGSASVSVGTYLGGGKYRDKVYWGHILEGGHKIVLPSGKVVGFVAAKPFMSPAYKANQKKVAETMADIVFGAMGL